MMPLPLHLAQINVRQMRQLFHNATWPFDKVQLEPHDPLL